jgi:serine-type D-Ala-D-Ala carboxypeptidase (penicillin-binding protein 5/6)
VTGRLVAAVVAALALAAPAAAFTSPPPQVDARAYVVANAATGDVLAAHDGRTELPIASITKLMTVIVALEHLRLRQVVIVDRPSAAVGESTINLRAGERISVDDLLKGALIQSANDAADALADAAADGDTARFVGWMNEKARELGLRDTHFARPDGLDAPGHYSSARDVLKLAEVAMHDPTIRAIVRERTDTISGDRVLHTWNDLLGVFPGLVGVKTGHTGAAGWCEVAAARRSGYSIYVVVLGSPTRSVRNAALESLLSWGVSQYRVAPLVRPGKVYASVQVGWGKRALPLVATRRLLRPYRLDRPVVARVVAPGAVSLPVRRGEALGRVELWEGARLLGTRPLVAARSVSPPGLGGRVAFYAGRTLHHVWGFFS